MHEYERIDALYLVKVGLLYVRFAFDHAIIQFIEILSVLINVVELKDQDIEEMEYESGCGPEKHASFSPSDLLAKVTTPNYSLELACKLQLFMNEPESET